MPPLFPCQSLHAMRHAWRQTFHSVKQYLSLRERRCALCHDAFMPSEKGLTKASHILCAQCLPKLPQRTHGYCPYCGALMALDSAPCTPCSQCMQKPPPWDHLYFYGIYEHALRHVMLAAKFHNDSTALSIAGVLLTQACMPLRNHAYTIDAIIAVPLHTLRLGSRGANQCTEIARILSLALHTPIRHDLLYRIRNTDHQVGLKKAERLQNLDNAFQASSACKGLHVLLVDDIMTTGTTLRRCAEALHAQNVGSVSVAVVARTHMP